VTITVNILAALLFIIFSAENLSAAEASTPILDKRERVKGAFESPPLAVTDKAKIAL
jgi:hypothetical protein